MLDKTIKSLKEEAGKTILPTCDPIPSPIVGMVKIAKALKEDYTRYFKEGFIYK